MLNQTPKRDDVLTQPQRALAPRRARGGTVGEASMAGAIGQAFDRRVAAKTEILRSGRADRPAASLLAQLEQRAAMFLADRVIIKEHFGLGVHRLQHPILQPRRGLQARSLDGAFCALSRPASQVDSLFAGQVEARELADDGVAADPDVGGDLAAG